MPLIIRPSQILLLLTLLTGVGVTACGDSDADTGSSAGSSPSPAPTVLPDLDAASDPAVDAELEPVTDDAAATSAAVAVVTFEADGSTREFALQECFTSFTAPGKFVEGNDDKGGFSSFGTDPDGWELQLSVLYDASGDAINMSFLTDGKDADYQLGDLDYTVTENVVTASASSDIYQTVDEEEAIPLSFVVTC